MRKLLPLGLFAAAVAVTASAQPPVAPSPRPKGQKAEAVAAAVAPEPREVKPPPPPAPPAKPEGPKESYRLTKLKQQTYDRRPSAALKAWAPAKKTAGPAPKMARSPNTPGMPDGPDGPGGPDGNPGGPDGNPAAAAAAKAAAEKAAAEKAKNEATDQEIAAFVKKVTLGDWAGVKAYLAGLPDEEAVPAYRQLLRSLSQRPMPNMGGGMPPGMSDDEYRMMMMQQQGPAQQFAEKHAFTADDLMGLAAAAPTVPNPTLFPARVAGVGGVAAVGVSPVGLDKDNLAVLSGILRETVASGTLAEVLVAKMKADAAKPAGQATFTRRQVAKLLILSGETDFAGDFLPTFEQAAEARDGEGLNLLARYFVAQHAKEAKGGNLEKAWAAVQAVLANPLSDPDDKEEGLLRAVELAPRLKEELGQAWLDASFTKDPARGMEILASVGTAVSRGISTKPMAIDDRLNALKLMKTAVEALLKASPEKVKEWKNVLTLLAAGWMREAEFSQRFDTTSGNRLRQDRYGNMYMSMYDDDDDMMRQQMMMRQGGMPRPILVADVMKAAPSPAWVAAIDPSLRPRLAGTAARLHLKVEEEDKAFPLIEQLAPDQPVQAKELVKEFLQVWTRNHDPNAARNRYRYSWFFYAYEARADGIPLTRSKQERNLQELAKWARRIRALPQKAGELDDQILVKAFTACHSSAEVYRTEAIEAVFGPMAGLKPKTIAGLAVQMRGNLAGLWKDPGEQQRKKTNRKKKDIEQEVLRGYAVATKSVEDGLGKFPGHYALMAAYAGLLHDEVNYRQELNKSADFSARRDEAFRRYQAAAADYAKQAPGMPAAEQNVDVYEEWFSASLGAVDLGMITEEKQPDWRQPPLIRKALLGLPGELAEQHLAKFANNLFVRMSGAKPHVKFNYLKAGFQVVEDHPRASEAKKLFDYYKDLVSEIKFEALPDLGSSTRVGHGRPFGLFVNIRHTRDIERESGGFSRYLQNQNSGYFSYNYGRPTADYKDRFESVAREALKEHFEVLSVSFRDDKVHSRSAAEFGWRYTPYAYILLKPRGPQVDKIPPLRLDLDFLDTSGYVVMPIETPTIPIDAKDPQGDARPVKQLSVTQTLDERQADKGVLILEVKAVGLGLVPDLKELIDPVFDGFDVTKTDEPPVAVKKFDDEADGNFVVSERAWTLTLTPKGGAGVLPSTFRFASVKVPTKESVYQRYVDADLLAVEQEATLEKRYGTASTRWMWVAGVGAVLGLGVLGLLVWAVTRRPAGPAAERVPTDADPFMVAALLRRERARRGLSPVELSELDQDLAAVERYYFSADRNGSPAPDLAGLAAKWTAAGRRVPAGA